MKILFVCATALFSFSARAQTLEERLDALENKVNAMQSAIEKKLGRCEMTYKHHNYRLNRCDQGTFVRSSRNVGPGAVQLECGYYQLKCTKDQN